MFYVLAPEYNARSAGIVALHRLYEELVKQCIPACTPIYRGIGDDVSILVGEDEWIAPEQLINITKGNTIFIVPEVDKTTSLSEGRITPLPRFAGVTSPRHR